MLRVHARHAHGRISGKLTFFRKPMPVTYTFCGTISFSPILPIERDSDPRHQRLNFLPLDAVYPGSESGLIFSLEKASSIDKE